MNTPHRVRQLLALIVAGTLAVGPAYAEKPEWAGKGKDKAEKHADKADKKADKHAMKAEKKADKKAAKREDVRIGGYFNESHRTVVTTYYGEHYGSGKRCPPGLAKKNNGCMPPGQAKKYVVGQPLPSTVRYYAVPQPVLVQLPPPPVGHRYVTVAGDIVLLAVGSMMVVDALTNLTR
jgi:Ni/Co efflux regulator RcnB